MGEVQPIQRVEVRARVDGVIEARPFTEGSLVKAGQVLYRLERVRYDAAYRSASARSRTPGGPSAGWSRCSSENAVAQQDVDNARTEVEAAEAAYDEARKDREDAVVRAEIAGRVGRTRLEVGARVTGPADLLTTIDQLDPVYVSFRPSSQDQLSWRQDPRSRKLIQPGSRLGVRVVLPDGTELPRDRQARLREPSLDPATGTQEFRASFANADLALVPGQFVRVRLHGLRARQRARRAPARGAAVARPAVRAGGRQGRHGRRPRRRAPAPGAATGGSSSAASEPGERVVVDGVQKAAPGQPVRPVALADSAVTREARGRTARRRSTAARRPAVSVDPNDEPASSSTSSSGGRCSPP